MENRVRKFRRDLEISQEELARKANTTRQTIISIEKGHTKDLYHSLAVKIADALGKPVGEVFLAHPVTHEQRNKVG
jgi:putative transcriptional regulator